MSKNYFIALLLSSVIAIPAFAGDSVFSNSSSEQFELKPLNNTAAANVNTAAPATAQTLKPATSDLANKNYTSAISNLNNAQVELREQMASYSALMAQAKSNYENKKDEYKAYKKEYNALKRKMNKIEKTKKLIQSNITSAVQTN